MVLPSTNYQMDESLFEAFLAIFDKCETENTQPYILAAVRSYLNDHKKKLAKVANRRYHDFYKGTETVTGRWMGQTQEIREKSYEELDKDYYEESVNKLFLKGKYKNDFALAVYFWFHYFNEDYAVEIDKSITKIYPRLQKKLDNIKPKIKEQGFIEHKQESKKATHSEEILSDGNNAPNYYSWDNVDPLRVFDAAHLWMDEEPPLVSSGPSRTTVSIFQYFHNLINQGRLPVAKEVIYAGAGMTRWLSRETLKTLAHDRGERPKFLYPEER